jgi:hypothetical protein
MKPHVHSVTVLDGLAARLAELSGISWERLSNHPGYERNYWRDNARAMLNAVENPPVERNWIARSPNAWSVGDTSAP